MTDNTHDNVTQEAKSTPHDVPTVRVKTDDGSYKIINRRDYDEKEHGPIIKGGEDQQQGVGVSDRNPSGTFSEPTPSDIRYPNKDATEFENNHGAFVNKSAAQMREAAGLADAPGGLYPEGMMRVERVGPHEHRIMSGDREVMRGVGNRDADKWNSMSDEDKNSFVKDHGGKAPDVKAGRRDDKGSKGSEQARTAGTHPAPSQGEQNGVAGQSAQPVRQVPPVPPRGPGQQR